MRETRIRRLTRRRQLWSALAVVALAVALVPITSFAKAAEKVDVCHVNGVSDPIPTFTPDTNPLLFYPGQVISVAEAAVAAHVAHGDSATAGYDVGEYRTDPGGLANVQQSAKDNELTFWSQADCFITR